jgi:hypothetical protein
MNDSRHAPFPRLASALFLPLLLLLYAAQAAAQSQDVSFPTPARTNELSGTIAARDIGDARLTRHFYILTGTPGDLVFTVTSNNLNGDVDLFTAGSLRPLGKISLFAGARATSATKTIFVKQRESLILRVEARSANDNEGTYSIRFDGTFEPVMTAATPEEDNATASTANASGSTDANVRRVTSSGARIDEPPPPPPAPETTARTEASTTETGTTTTETTATPAPAATESRSGAEAAPVEPAPTTKPERTARAPRRPRGRRTRATTPPASSQPGEPATESGSAATASTTGPTLNPRLIIETRDGMRTERFMSTVRSVTVQNGQIVIVSSDGRKTERISLGAILRMSIEQ